MANINDYLAWRGDVTLAERPFNDADNVILATLSYLDFTGFVPEQGSRESVSVSDACTSLLAETGTDVSSRNRSLASVDANYLHLLAESRRFGDALLSQYVDTRDEQTQMQFAAVHVGLSDGTTYISFRGTDQTLLGWREDFMLSFEVTGAQGAAACYLDQTTQPRHSYLVGGHSKGGNLAAYAAIACQDETRERLSRIYSNDGPSMASDVLPKGGHEVLGDRFVRIVPNFSVVGMLFERPGDTKTIVRSNAAGALAHDPFSWQVKASGLETAEDLLPECKVVNKAFADWLDGMSIEDRTLFTNDFFDALEAGGATTVDEVGGSVGGLQKVVAALNSTNDRSKEVMTRLIQAAMNSAADAAKDSATKALEEARASAGSALEAAKAAAAERADEARKAAIVKARGLMTPGEKKVTED